MTTTAKKTPAPKKVVAKKPVAVKAAVSKEAVARPTGAYTYAIGRRKTSTAQTRLFSAGTGTIVVNDQPMTEYFPSFDLQEAVLAPLKVAGLENNTDVHLKVSGGGKAGQSIAARLGISRALIEVNPALRKSLKKLGYLMRDPREKERKKFGHKRARKSAQWAKR